MASVIAPLVDELKKYNPEIGTYKSTVINVKLNHLVKFSNGYLEVPRYFYEEYRDQPGSVAKEQFERLAMTFQRVQWS